MQSFDDVKVESNKVVSTNIQRLSIASRLIQGQANKIKKKIRPQIISLVDWFSP